MNRTIYQSLTEIVNGEDLKENEVYYSIEHTTHGNAHMDYYKLYDKDLNKTREVLIKYTDAVKGLIRVMNVKNRDDHTYSAYKLIPLNDNFCKVEIAEYTRRELIAMNEEARKQS